MHTDINAEKVAKDAEAYFLSGEYHCSEAIVASVRKNIDPSIPAEAIAMASAFPGGLGNSGCLCGAVAGAAMSCGWFSGRQEPGDKRSRKARKQAKEIHDAFKTEFKSTCCRVLTRQIDRENKKVHCSRFVGFAAETAARIIAGDRQGENGSSVTASQNNHGNSAADRSH